MLQTCHERIKNAKQLKSSRKRALNLNNKLFCSPVSYLLNFKRFVSKDFLF